MTRANGRKIAHQASLLIRAIISCSPSVTWGSEDHQYRWRFAVLIQGWLMLSEPPTSHPSPSMHKHQRQSQIMIFFFLGWAQSQCVLLWGAYCVQGMIFQTSYALFHAIPTISPCLELKDHWGSESWITHLRSNSKCQMRDWNSRSVLGRSNKDKTWQPHHVRATRKEGSFW